MIIVMIMDMIMIWICNRTEVLTRLGSFFQFFFVGVKN